MNHKINEPQSYKKWSNKENTRNQKKSHRNGIHFFSISEPKKHSQTKGKPNRIPKKWRKIAVLCPHGAPFKSRGNPRFLEGPNQRFGICPKKRTKRKQDPRLSESVSSGVAMCWLIVRKEGVSCHVWCVCYVYVRAYVCVLYSFSFPKDPRNPL